jgi:hypothetical protein
MGGFPRLSQAGNDIQIGIELNQPIEQLMTYSRGIRTLYESRVESTRFIVQRLAIDPTLLFNCCGFGFVCVGALPATDSQQPYSTTDQYQYYAEAA